MSNEMATGLPFTWNNVTKEIPKDVPKQPIRDLISKLNTNLQATIHPDCSIIIEDGQIKLLCGDYDSVAVNFKSLRWWFETNRSAIDELVKMYDELTRI